MSVSAPEPVADTAIIIPAVSVNPLVSRCLDVCRAECPGAEVILLLDIEPAEMPPGVTVVVTGPVSIGAKRNRGADHTDRRILAFIDSDAYPAAGWLQAARRELDADPDLWICGGPNVPPPNETGSARWVGLAQQSPLVTGPLNFRKQVAPARYCDDLPSCNMVLRRADYLTLGGMDETLYIYEDKDLCRRVCAGGHKILYTPDVLVYHQDRPLKLFLFQRLVWGANSWTLATRTQRFSDAIIFLPSAAVLFFLSGAAIPWLPVWAWVYGPVAALYVLMVAVETLRRAAGPRDLPGLALTLLIGNLGPGIGALAEILRLMPNHRRLYRNHE